ncbi:hypothetical protein UB31_00585 [Bradyrhizobium sp. LTSP849]|uniref:hypothetical protein n=1 Tax=Bradyrhizobium sp. LTSP849 TaxID=1615890 RepID=UPI0005D135DD|nr:hypothetical protein [Bradyrhizobium sp. LTSP849]KJC55509.1 hypothetical protein UB31_00585 [Bradyrhizobium sp. LTSP849]
MAERDKWSRENVIAMLLSHSGLFATDTFRFSATDMAKQLGCSPSNARTAFDFLSIEYGGLKDFPFENIFLGNPIWERPAIKEAADSYFCCFPQLFPAFAFHIFDRIFSLNEPTKQLVAKQRAEYLENEIANCFENAFGTHTIHPSVTWSYEGANYETDLLIQVDAQLFIVEAKSNRISWPALRGAPQRLKREIEALLIAPAIQSQRLENALRKKQKGEPQAFELGVNIDLAAVKEFHRLSVTLEDFSTIQSNLKAIEGTGLIADDFPKALTISLSDLKVVFEILDNPVERMHYLQRRKSIQESWEYLADELDLLGLYVGTGLIGVDFEAGKNRLMAIGMSQKIDAYFEALDQKIETPKPARRMTNWFRAIRDRLANRKPPGWTEAALALLDLGYDDQLKFESHFKSVCRGLKRKRQDIHVRQNTTVEYPPIWRKVGFACAAFYEDERAKRHNIMDNASVSFFEKSTANACLVMAQDVEGADYPYTTLVVYYRPDEIPAPI